MWVLCLDSIARGVRSSIISKLLSQRGRIRSYRNKLYSSSVKWRKMQISIEHKKQLGRHSLLIYYDKFLNRRFWDSPIHSHTSFCTDVPALMRTYRLSCIPACIFTTIILHFQLHEDDTLQIIIQGLKSEPEVFTSSSIDNING